MPQVISSQFDNLLNNDSSSGNGNYSFTTGTSRIVKTRVTRVIDGDTFSVADPDIKGVVRLSGADTPETAHGSQFWNNGNLLSRINKLRSQPYGTAATDYTQSLVEGKEVTLYIRGLDNNGRPIAKVMTEDGRDLSQELLKRGYAHPYFKGDPFYDPTVMTEEMEGIAVSNIVNGVGIYSNRNYVNPVKYKNGVLQLLGTSRREDLRQVAYYNATHLAQKYGVDNPQLVTLFDDTNVTGGLSVPSQMGPSYFYAVALHNNMMRQGGMPTEIINNDNTAVLGALYRIAIARKTDLVQQQTPYAVRRFDVELTTPGLGMWLNEHWFMPVGLGRLYKDELGFLPSLTGAIGRVLDKTYLYYTDPRSDSAKLSEDMSRGASYKEPKAGFFESLLGFSTNLALSSAAAVSLYLAVGEPLNLILGESFKNQTQDLLDLAFASDGPTMPEALRRRAAANLGLGLEHWGEKDGTSLKASVVKRLIDLQGSNKEFYDISSFSLTPYHANSAFFRKRAEILLSTIVKPFLVEHINPYRAGSEDSRTFVDAIDKLIAEVGRPVGLQVHNNKFGNLQDLYDALQDPKLAKTIGKDEAVIMLTNVGAERQQNVARALQGVLDAVPLNPLNWRIFGGIDESGAKPLMVGNILSFAQATDYMQKVFLGANGLGGMFSKTEVMPGTGSDNVGSAIHRKAKGLFRAIQMAAVEGTARVNTQAAVAKKLNRVTSAFRAAEESLISGGATNLEWSDNGDVRVVKAFKLDALPTQLFDAMIEYEDFLKGHGYEVDTVSKLSERIAESKIMQMTASTAGDLLRPGIGSEPSLSRSKAKIAMYAILALDIAIVGNELFQSSGGASIFTQIAASVTTGQYGLAPEFTAGRFLPTISIFPSEMASNVLVSSAYAGGMLMLARHVAHGMRRPVTVPYSIKGEAVEALLKVTKGNIGFKLISDEDMQGAAKGVAGVFHLAMMDGDKVTRSFQLFRKVAINGAITYEKPVIRMMGDINRNTAIVFGVGMLATQGARSATAGLLQLSRNWTSTSSSLFQEGGRGSLDPLIFGAAGAAGLGSLTKSGRGIILGALAGGALGFITNAIGIRLTDVGTGMHRVDPAMASAISQIANFKRLVKERLDSGQRPSNLELMAAFYGGELSKVLPALDQDRMGPTVQVIAKQSPLPFIQFFLAETIKGRPTLPNGAPDNSKGGTSYYSVGIQSAPIFGVSISTQLPIKIYRGGGMFGLGVAYNEQSNTIDFIQSVGLLTGTATLTVAVGQMLSNLIDSKLGPSGSYKPGMISMTSITKSYETANRIIRYGTRAAEAIPATAYRIVRGMAVADLGVYGGIANAMNKSLPVFKAPTQAQLFKSLALKGMVGMYVGSILGSTGAALLGRKDPADITMGGLLGTFTVGPALTILGPEVFELSKNLIPSAARLARLSARGMYNRMPTHLQRTVASTGSFLWNRMGKPIYNLRHSGRAKVFGLFAGIAYAITDPNFGYSRDMDKYDGREDIVYRLSVMSMYAATMTSITYGMGKMGMSNADTLDAYANILEKTKNTPAGPKGVQALRHWWLKLHERALAQDSAYIIDMASRMHEVANSPDAKADADIHRISQQMAKTNAMKVDSGEQVFNLATDGDKDALIKIIRGDHNDPNVGEGLSSLARKAGAVNRRVRPTLLSRRAIRSLAWLGLGTATTAALLTGGGQNREAINNIFDGLETGFNTGIKPLQYLGSILADTFRLVTGQDRSIERMGPLPTPMVPGSSFGLSASPVKYRKLVKGPDRNSGANKIWKDISSLFILDEPNAFLNFYNLFGVTFRTGEYGTRNSMYIQMQSAGQDISTAVYSMSAAFLFKESFAGNNDLAINTIKALKAVSNAANSESGLSKLAEKDLRKAAVNLMSVTAHLQPLKERRKISKVDESVLGLIGGDDLVAGAIDYRSKMTAHMSFQPSQSLVSDMLIRAMNHKDAVGIIMDMMNGNRENLYKIFNDSFGNVTRDIKIVSAKFFEKDAKTGRLRGLPTYVSDPSQWADMYSPFVPSDDNGQGSFIPSGFAYGLSMVASSIGPLQYPLYVFLGAAVGTMGMSMLTTMNARRQFNQLQQEVDRLLNEPWYTKGGTRGAPDSPYSFTVRQQRGLYGSVMEEGGRPKLIVHKGSRYFQMNNTLLTGRSTRDLSNIKAINDAMAQMEVAIQNSYMGKMYGADADKSFLDNMRTTVNQKLAEQAPSIGDSRSEYIDKLRVEYREQLNKLVDNYFEAITDIQVDINGKKVRLVALLNPDLDLSDPNLRLDTPQDLEKAMPQLVGAKEELKKSLEKTVEDVLQREVRGGGFFGWSDRIEQQLIHSMNADQTTSIKVLTEKVLQEVTKSPAFGNLINNIGGLGRVVSIDYSQALQGEIENVIKFAGNVMSSTVRPKANKGTISTSTTVKVSDPAEIVRGGTLSKSIKAKAGWGGGLFELVNVIGLITDTFQAFDIFSSFSRLAAAQDNPNISRSQLALIRNEAGSTVTNVTASIGLGYLATLGIGKAMTAISTWWAGILAAGGLTIGGAAAGTGATAAATGVTIPPVGLVILGLLGAAAITAGGIALWKKFVAPAMDKASNTSGYKSFTKFIGDSYYAVSDGVGYLFGEALPSVSHMIAGDRGKAGATMAVGTGLAGAAFGVGLLAFGAVGGWAAVGIIGLAAAGVGGVLGLMFPDAIANVATTISRVVSAWKIGSVPIGAMIASSPNSITEQPRYGFSHPGSPFMIGTAQQVIDAEYKTLLQGAADPTGKQTAALFTSPSLYGQAVSDSPYKDLWSRNLGNIRPMNFMADSTISREFEIRAQYYNQSIVGRYMWRTMAKSANNYKDIQASERRFEETLAAQAVQVLKNTSDINIKILVKDVKSMRQLEDAGIISNLAEVNALITSTTARRNQEFSISIPKQSVTSRSEDSTNFNAQVQTGNKPIIKQGLKVNKKEEDVSVGKQKAVDNDLESTAKQYLINKAFDPSTAHLMMN
jgi:endonuclease YncB( thermonuclease family)